MHVVANAAVPNILFADRIERTRHNRMMRLPAQLAKGKSARVHPTGSVAVTAMKPRFAGFYFVAVVLGPYRRAVTPAACRDRRDLF